MTRTIVLLSLIGLAAPVGAQPVGTSDFRTVSELSVDGFEPFAAQGGGAIFGMHKGTDIFLCFLADNAKYQSERQNVMTKALKEPGESRTVPNIPLACVKTE